MLVDLASRHDFLIVEDSPYRELRYEGEHIPTMYSLDPDRVIHLGSFSKIFAPGFRLGWAIAHPELLDKIYVCKQSLDLCPPIFDQYVAAEFLSSGRLDENLKKSIELYKGKRDLLLGLLDEHMPECVRWTHPEGGLFLFLNMPEGFDAVKFYDKALDAGVAYVQIAGKTVGKIPVVYGQTIEMEVMEARSLLERIFGGIGYAGTGGDNHRVFCAVFKSELQSILSVLYYLCANI